MLCTILSIVYNYLLYDVQMASARGVEANVFDCNIVVSEFELQSRLYVRFQTKVLG